MNLLSQSASVNVSAWQNFYVIVGSAGGALIGIQFVVIALIANLHHRASSETIDAFGTPTVVHFGGALAIAAIMTAPWPSLRATSVALAMCGVGGLGYAAITFRRARRQSAYKPVLEDWIWYVIVPCCLYGALAVAAFCLRATTLVSPFMIGGVAMGLLFTGIHNAWDTITHLVATRPPVEGKQPE